MTQKPKPKRRVTRRRAKKGRHYFTQAHEDAIVQYARTNDIKERNVGQAVVVRSGYIIAIEGQDGTDSMLRRANILMK